MKSWPQKPRFRIRFGFPGHFVRCARFVVQVMLSTAMALDTFENEGEEVGSLNAGQTLTF